MRNLIVLAIFTFLSVNIFSQKTIDVIYTQKGEVYKGTILSDTNNTISIETLAQNTLVFPSSEISKVEQEKLISSIDLKSRGYFNYTSFGVHMGSTANELNAPLSILVENNYRINHISFGITSGLELLNEATVPFAFNLKGLIPFEGGSIFYIGGLVGYSFSVEDPKDQFYEIRNSYGGTLAGIEAGLQFPAYGHVGMFIAAGYRYNELSYTRSDGWVTEVDRTIYFNRISLRVGLVFL